MNRTYVGTKERVCEMKALESYKDIFCGELHRKIYICNSLAAGRHLVKAISKHYGTVYGVEVETLQSLIMKEYTGELEILSTYKARDVILQLMKESASNFWKNKYAQTRKVAKDVHKILTELDLEEVTIIKLQADTLPERIIALEEIRSGFAKYKKENKVHEYPDLLKIAKTTPRNSRIYVDNSCQFTTLEQSYLDTLGTINKIGLEEDLDPAVVRSKIKDRSQLIACKGNEITFILKDIIASGESIENIGIMLWDGIDVYDLYTHASAMEIPLTLSQGIPMKSSSMYQMLTNIQEFINNDYSAEVLYGMFNSNTFSLKRQRMLSNILIHYKVSCGKERYQELFIDELEASVEEINRTIEKQEIDNIKEFFTALLSLNIGKKHQKIENLIAFLGKYSRHSKEEEQQAYGTTKSLILECHNIEGNDLLTQVLELMEEKTYMSNIAGGIHCGPVTEDLYVERLYMAGMIADSISPSPLLFEEDREATDNLKTNLDIEKTRENIFYKMLNKHQGKVIFTYTSYHTGKQVPMTPNYAYGDLKQSEIVETEEILSLDKDTIAVAKVAIGELEMSDIPSHKDQVKDVCFSATSLEEALECPLKFYLKKLLGVYKEKMYEIKDYKWLEGNERGTFIHHVLDKYYTHQVEHGEKMPDVGGFLSEQEAELIKKYHCNNKEIQEKELESIRKTIRDTIEYFDSATDFSIYQSELEVGKEESFVLKIGTGEETEEIHFTGSIDRVDRNANGQLRIVDYKSGRISNYLDEKKMQVKLQSYLYKLVMEHMLAQAEEKTEVIESGYFFTEHNTVLNKNNIQSDENILIQLLALLGDEKQIITNGLKYKRKVWNLETAKSNNDCKKYCDYQTFCRKRDK